MLIRTAIVVWLLVIVSICLLGFVLDSHHVIFREFQAAWLLADWMLLVCLAVWCGTFIFLTFSLNDLPLIGLLFIAIAAYFIGDATARREPNAIILLFGVTLGRGTRFLLRQNEEGRMQNSENTLKIVNRKSAIVIFLVGLVGLLAFSSWWHLDLTKKNYHGPRWMGLWDNPNIYGMLMGAGVTLAIGLRAGMKKEELRMKNSGGERSRPGCGSTRPASNPGNANDEASLAARGARAVPIILFIAAGMMLVGLVMSYSRGAWLATAVGFLYLAKAYGKFKWRHVILGAGVLALGSWLFWGQTPDNAPWYLKRMDFGRPSSQHRVAAWRGAIQIMWDHPFGVGWNKAIGVYEKNYSPPEGGASAITMNSYLMLGTELGLPALLCFVAYVGLCLRSPKPIGSSKSKVQSPKSQSACEDARPTKRQDACATLDIGHWTLDSSKTACRAGAIVLLVAFWFDGGLFTLATASVFWILLELGAERKVDS